jgi:hypothetical protein
MILRRTGKDSHSNRIAYTSAHHPPQKMNLEWTIETMSRGRNDAAPDFQTWPKDFTIQYSLNFYSKADTPIMEGSSSPVAVNNKQTGHTAIKGTVKESSPTIKQEAHHGSVFQYFGADDWSATSAGKQTVGSTKVFSFGVHPDPATSSVTPQPNSDVLAAAASSHDSAASNLSSPVAVDSRGCSPRAFTPVYFTNDVPVTPPANTDVPLNPPVLQAPRFSVFYFDLDEKSAPPVLSLREHSSHGDKYQLKRAAFKY